MAAPVDEKLFFCGEVILSQALSLPNQGTVTENNGTVHGAYLSGIRAAKEVLGEADPDCVLTAKL